MVFDKHMSKYLPAHTFWDHTINLTSGLKSKPCKTYPLLLIKQVKLNTFLDENLAKGYLCPSKSPMTSPFFFIKKKDKKLCPVQDYCELNKTIKNQYPLLLIPELIDKFKGTKIFSKIDLHWGYNNIGIKEGDK